MHIYRVIYRSSIKPAPVSSAKREFPICRREIELTLRQKQIENVILIKEKKKIKKRASFGVFEIAMHTEVFW